MEFRVQGSGFRVHGLGFRGSGFRVDRRLQSKANLPIAKKVIQRFSGLGLIRFWGLGVRGLGLSNLNREFKDSSLRKAIENSSI